ncbi:MAG: 30S ribosomal protein S2 [Anaerolineae bacterium]|nr:30S ribosomal protein S2 [Anaerolineae bacterium]MDW8172997.1 30S ribosomal protein S2 [Anaerolineae bacterium]
MPSKIKMKELLETGVHFGHRTTKWNPKMREFIFTARNGIHIIDLQQTLANLNAYYDTVRELAQNRRQVLFVGTKRQAQEIIAKEAQRCGMPYVSLRWLPGTLTNWTTIKRRIDTLKKMEKQRDNGEWARLPKKEALMNERKLVKLQERLGGLREMKNLPSLVIVVDSDREATAVAEANALNIPVLGIVDTNSDPDVVDYIIPGNDDAMRSIRLLVSALADAVVEGKTMRGKGDDEEEPMEVAPIPDTDDDASDEELLGAETLRKLRSNKFTFDDDDV